jgi:hypothetical protein
VLVEEVDAFGFKSFERFFGNLADVRRSAVQPRRLLEPLLGLRIDGAKSRHRPRLFDSTQTAVWNPPIQTLLFRSSFRFSHSPIVIFVNVAYALEI